MGVERLRQDAKRLRRFRKLHRYTGVILFIFFFIIAGTSLLLGWKKNSYGIILPKTQQGVSSDLKTWLPLDSLQNIAFRTLEDSFEQPVDKTVSKMDIRPQKGVVKFIFEKNYWEVQLDGSTGELLSLARRNSDLIENIHDGSVMDKIFGTEGIFKIFYTSLMGIALIIFIITGFWLWYGPKRIKRRRKQKQI